MNQSKTEAKALGDTFGCHQQGTSSVNQILQRL